MEMGIKRGIIILDLVCLNLIQIILTVLILLLISCTYHTEIPCPFGLTMKQLDEKCDYIQHGSTSKWVLKKEQ